MLAAFHARARPERSSRHPDGVADSVHGATQDAGRVAALMVMPARDRRRADAAGTVAVLALMLSGCSVLGLRRVNPALYARFLQHESTGTVTARFLGTSSIVFSDGNTVVISDGFVGRPGVVQAVGSPSKVTNPPLLF